MRERDHGVCVSCGDTGDHLGNPLEVHHVFDVATYGAAANQAAATYPLVVLPCGSTPI